MASDTLGGSLPTVPFLDWIEKVKPELKPPVGNKLLYEGQLKVMVIAGPNQRKDFHIEEGEEIFYQIQGDMRLDIMECGKLREVVIREGEMFLLPARIPHSPQRFPNTSGLVIERERLASEIDGLRWYAPDGTTILYEEWFHCFDLGVQLKPVIERYFASEEYRTGVPKQTFNDPKINIDMVTRPPGPIDFRSLIHLDGEAVEQLYNNEFKVTLYRGNSFNSSEVSNGEVFIYQLKGSSTVEFLKPSTKTSFEKTLHEQDVLLLPPQTQLSIKAVEQSIFLHVTNHII